MIAAPLTLATIIGMAFSGFSNGDVGFDPIPLVIVNQDQPVQMGAPGDTAAATDAGNVQMGERFVQALVPPANATAEEISANSLWQIINASVMTDTDSALATVDSGESTAVLVIPPDFTARLMAGNGMESAGSRTETTAPEPVHVNLFVDPAASDLTQIVEGVVTSIGSQLTAGSVSTQVAIEALFGSADTALAQELAARLQEGSLPFEEILSTQGVAIPLEREAVSGQELTFNPFLVFGTSQAIFFMLFTAMATSAEFLRDKRNGILRRLMASPTPIATIVLGKIGAAAVTCAAQVLILLTALTLINAVVMRQFTMIFGTNIGGLLLVIAAVALAASGLAMAVAAFARTPEQAQAINSVVAMGMGLLGVHSSMCRRLMPCKPSRGSRLTSGLWMRLHALQKGTTPSCSMWACCLPLPLSPLRLPSPGSAARWRHNSCAKRLQLP
jgi:ABC-type Na+ efflux pump permease subunit